MLFLAGIFCFTTACKKDETYFTPVITLTSASVFSGSQLIAGDSARIEFTIKASKDLTTLVIYNAAGTKIQSYTDFTTDRVYSYHFLSVAGKEIYEIAVTDKPGNTSYLYLSVTTNPKIESIISGTVTDICGNSYKTVVIGSQTWMAENLRTTLYTDNSAISNVTDTSWNNLITGALCSYNNTTTADSIKTFGRLYNWYAVSSGKLCPQGWHVPSKAEWSTLATYLTTFGYGYGGSGSFVAKSLANISGWETSTEVGDVGNGQATNNNTGFSALPGGERNDDGEFVEIGENANWWTSTPYFTDYSYYEHIGSYYKTLDSNVSHKNVGLSVRCVKN